MIRIVYSPHYDIGFFGLERLHPFDSRKYGRAYRELREQIGSRLKSLTVSPPRQVTRQELLNVHADYYLDSLASPAVVARALELATYDAASVENLLLAQRRRRQLPTPTLPTPKRRELIDEIDLEPADPGFYDRFCTDTEEDSHGAT